MRSIRINGQRVHCVACKSRYAVISIDGFAVCSKCLKAFFVGVKVGEIDPKTMESKCVKGLYFAGELIDVDAYTGGFNLQIAWATGRAAGEAAAEQGETA